MPSRCRSQCGDKIAERYHLGRRESLRTALQLALEFQDLGVNLQTRIEAKPEATSRVRSTFSILSGLSNRMYVAVGLGAGVCCGGGVGMADGA